MLQVLCSKTSVRGLDLSNMHLLGTLLLRQDIYSIAPDMQYA